MKTKKTTIKKTAMTLDDLVDMAIREWTPEERKQAREILRWSLYDSKLRKVVH